MKRGGTLSSGAIARFFRAWLASSRVEPEEPRSTHSPLDRALVAIAALLCLLFTATLTDTGYVSRAPSHGEVATAGPGDASVFVTVVDESDAPIPGAVVRVFIIDETPLLAGEAPTSDRGQVLFESLREGEAWIFAYADGRGRASTRLILGKDRRDAKLRLHRGVALAVRVVDENDAPLEGATVETRGTDPLPFVARTNKEGRAIFDRLDEGPFDVVGSYPGYASVARAGVLPDAEPLVLRMVRQGGFEVSVVTQGGEEVEGAEVQIAGPTLWPARTTTTDENGIAKIGGLARGVYDLRAQHAGRVSRTELSVPLRQGGFSKITLVLEEGRMIRIVVTDGLVGDRGGPPDPIEGAQVSVVEEGLSAFPLEATTDKEGAVLLGPLVEESATVLARAKGFVARNALITDTDEEITLPLLKGGRITGEVVDARGFPVPGASLEVIGTDLDGMPIQDRQDRSSFSGDLFAFSMGGPIPLIARGELGVMPGPVPPIPRAGDPFMNESTGGGTPWVSGIDGTFDLSPVTPGRVHLFVKHPDYIEAITDTITLAPGGEAKVRVVLGEGGRLEGRVVEENGFPVPSARIELAALEGTFEAISYTADDGTFAFAAVPEDVLLSVTRVDAPAEIAAREILYVESKRRTEVRIVLPAKRDPLPVRVRDHRGAPVSGVEVRAVSLDEATSLRRTTFTDDEGKVEIPGAKGLPLLVYFDRPTFAPTVLTTTGNENELEQVLNVGLVMSGRITTRQGRDGVPQADITLFTRTGTRHVFSETDGTFEVDDLAPGRIRVVVHGEGFARDERILTFEGDPRHKVSIEGIELVPAGRVEGRVVDARGDGVAGARVGEDAVPTFLPVGKLPRGLAQTDKNGGFVLDGLPEGIVSLEAYSPELGRGRLEGVEIRAARTKDRVVIEIPDQDYSPQRTIGGGSLALTLAERDGAVIVLDVPPGGEAEYAGLEPEDRIVSIRQKRVSTIEAARARITGPLAEDVILEVMRKVGSTEERVVVRARRETVRR